MQGDVRLTISVRDEFSDVLKRMGLGCGGQVLMTIHRSATVDDPDRLKELSIRLDLPPAKGEKKA